MLNFREPFQNQVRKSKQSHLISTWFCCRSARAVAPTCDTCGLTCAATICVRSPFCGAGTLARTGHAIVLNKWNSGREKWPIRREYASKGQKFRQRLIDIERNSPLQSPLPLQRPLFGINFVSLQQKSIVTKRVTPKQVKSLKTWTTNGYMRAKFVTPRKIQYGDYLWIVMAWGQMLHMRRSWRSSFKTCYTYY